MRFGIEHYRWRVIGEADLPSMRDYLEEEAPLELGGNILVGSLVVRRVATCRYCGLSGHNRRTCPTLWPHGLHPSARSSPTCRICGETGHNRRTCRLSFASAPYTANSKGLSKAEMDALPRHVVDSSLQEGRSDHKMEQGQCSICHDDFLQEQILIRLHCGHMYHPPCLTPWLTNHDQCPYCRDKI